MAFLPAVCKYIEARVEPFVMIMTIKKGVHSHHGEYSEPSRPRANCETKNYSWRSLKSY